MDLLDYYQVLEVDASCDASQIKAAYRALVLTKHPDKGGTREEFKAIQEAYETLSDHQKRRVYNQQLHSKRDLWTTQWNDESFRSGDISSQSSSYLISVLSRSHERIDPLKQLVVCCALCLRPSSFECWICRSPLCLFCSRTPHSHAEHPMHWPLNNTPHMIEKLGMQELEMKRKADAEAFEREDPNFMPLSQKIAARTFTDLSLGAYRSEHGALDFAFPLLKHHPGLEKQYAWTQTSDVVLVALMNPFFLPLKPDAAPSVKISPSANGDTIIISDTTDRDLPPILHRVLSNAIDLSVPYEVITQGPLIGLLLPKSHQRRRWSRLFRGDQIAMRAIDSINSMPCPGSYNLTHNLNLDEITMEMAVPRWIKPGDVAVDFSSDRVEVTVKGMPGCVEGERLIRTLAKGKRLETQLCHWALLSMDNGTQLLSIDLGFEQEGSEKKSREKGGEDGGKRVFTEDEDPHQLRVFLARLLSDSTSNV
jgi:hypothetical protein